MDGKGKAPKIIGKGYKRKLLMIEALLEELQKGICELTCVDEFSVEYLIIGTLSKNHMADKEDVIRAEKIALEKEKKIVEIWDVQNALWRKIPQIQIVDIERLTGSGIGKESENEMAFEEFLMSMEECEVINIPAEEENKLVEKEKDSRID